MSSLVYDAWLHMGCFAHASQSPERFYPLQSQVARFRGIESGYPEAEAFIRHVDTREDWLPPRG
jgi:hypothetical protein